SGPSNPALDFDSTAGSSSSVSDSSAAKVVIATSATIKTGSLKAGAHDDATNRSSSAADGASSVPLLGAGGCVSASVHKSFSPATHLTSISVHLYGNGSAAPACTAWLSSLEAPMFVFMRLAGAAVVEEVQQLGSYAPPTAFFKSSSSFVVPVRIREGAAATFRLAVADVAALNDICEQGALSDQLPDTCVLQLVSSASGVVATGLVGEDSGTDAGTVGEVPGFHVPTPDSSSPLTPPPLLLQPPVGVGASLTPPSRHAAAAAPAAATALGGSSSSGSAQPGLSRIGIITGMVVSCAMLAMIAAVALTLRRRWRALQAAASEEEDSQ
ncbi:hypothetical protein Agub_g10877, partial [Astrephomene gubernaculifera]